MRMALPARGNSAAARRTASSSAHSAGRTVPGSLPGIPAGGRGDAGRAATRDGAASRNPGSISHAGQRDAGTSPGDTGACIARAGGTAPARDTDHAGVCPAGAGSDGATGAVLATQLVEQQLQQEQGRQQLQEQLTQLQEQFAALAQQQRAGSERREQDQEKRASTDR